MRRLFLLEMDRRKLKVKKAEREKEEDVSDVKVGDDTRKARC